MSEQLNPEIDPKTGMWAVYDKQGNKQFVYSIDAREQMEMGIVTIDPPSKNKKAKKTVAKSQSDKTDPVKRQVKKVENDAVI